MMTKIQLYARIGVGDLRVVGADAVAEAACDLFRSRPEFYEYVNEPDDTPIGIAFVISGTDGFAREWRPGDVIRPTDDSLIVVGEFETS